MKKKLSLFIAAVLLLCTLPLSAGASQTTKITVDGKPVDMVAYNIGGNNFFKLRDIATILNGTPAQFEVTWNSGLSIIELKSNTPYSGTEGLTTDRIADPLARKSNSIIRKDRVDLSLLSYNISDNNYYKLRDIAALFDFGIVWDAATSTIGIDTSTTYTFPENTKAGISINPEYFFLYSKKGEYIEKLFGKGEPARIAGGLVEFTYPNGVIIGYENPFTTDTTNNGVRSVKLPLEMALNNCPANLTAEDAKALGAIDDGYSLKLFDDPWGLHLTTDTDTGKITYASPILTGPYLKSGETECIYVNSGYTYIERTLERSYQNFVEDNFSEGMYDDYGNCHDTYDLKFTILDFDGEGEEDLYLHFEFSSGGRVYTRRGDNIELLYIIKDGEYLCYNYFRDGEINICESVSTDDFMAYKFYTFRNGQKKLVTSAGSNMETAYVNGSYYSADTNEYGDVNYNIISSIAPSGGAGYDLFVGRY